MKVTSFGEVLWDDFPSGKVLGGAPLNVLVRLQSFGVDTAIISRRGDDADGEELLRQSKRKTSIPTCCKCAKNAIPAWSKSSWTNAAARHMKSYIPALGTASSSKMPPCNVSPNPMPSYSAALPPAMRFPVRH